MVVRDSVCVCVQGEMGVWWGWRRGGVSVPVETRLRISFCGGNRTPGILRRWLRVETEEPFFLRRSQSMETAGIWQRSAKFRV